MKPAISRRGFLTAGLALPATGLGKPAAAPLPGPPLHRQHPKQ